MYKVGERNKIIEIVPAQDCKFLYCFYYLQILRNYCRIFLTKIAVLSYHMYMNNLKPPSSRGLGHFPFTEVTGIRIPLGVIRFKIK